MHGFLAPPRRPAEGPAASPARCESFAFFVEGVARTHRHRAFEADLWAKARVAIAESFAVLARVPEMAAVRASDGCPGLPPERDDGAGCNPSRAVDLLRGGGAGNRFFFDIEDGERRRRDEVGIVLSSRDDIPREAKAVLFDLAHAEIPKGRARVFTATVRNGRGAVLYTASMTLKPDRSTHF